jgi:hypothetical protein
MSKIDKALERLRNNPKSVRFDDLDTLLLRLGFRKRQKGSHAFYTRGGLRIGVPHPHNQPYVLPVYVKQVIALLDELDEDDED